MSTRRKLLTAGKDVMIGACDPGIQDVGNVLGERPVSVRRRLRALLVTVS